jgi:NAD+ synthase (glutamine-hydrolysing)
MIWENGVCLAQQRFSAQAKHCVADVDLDLLCSTRRQTGIFDANRKHHHLSRAGFREIAFILDPAKSVGR